MMTAKDGISVENPHRRQMLKAHHGPMRWRRTTNLAAVLAAGALPSTAQAASPAWLPPSNFASSPGIYSLHDPTLALDPAGDAVVVWVAGPPNASIISAATRAAGSESWSTPTKLVVGNGVGPSVSFDEAGHVFAAFTSGTWPRYYVQYTSTSSVTAPWAEPITLSDPEDDGSGPVFAFDPAGDVLAAWTAWYDTDRAYGYFIQTSFKPAGGQWQHPLDLTARGTNSPRGISAALDRAGNAIAVWARAGPVADHPVVVAAYRPASTGVWEAPVPLSATLGDAYSMQVRFDQAGNAIAAWIAIKSGGQEQVQASYRPVGGQWQPPVDLSSVANSIDSLELRVAATGEAVAIWNQIAGSGVIYSAVRAARAKRWQAPVPLYAPIQGYFPATVALGIDPEGDAVALWSEWVGTAVRAAIRPASGHWQPAADAVAVPVAANVHVALDAAGDGLAVWQADDGRVIGGAELKGQGPLIDRVLIPKQAKVGVASRFSVTVLPWGSATLAGSPSWKFGDGKTGTGVSVRHVFRAAGTYTVSVTANDSRGGTTTASGTINVTKKKKQKRR
jgi:PKD domain